MKMIIFIAKRQAKNSVFVTIIFPLTSREDLTVTDANESGSQTCLSNANWRRALREMRE
jgi:hypothetical protein